VADIDFRALFDASPNAYMLLDTELRFVAANRAYLELTASRSEDLLGHALFDVFPHDCADPENANAKLLRASFERVLSSGQPDLIPLIAYRVPKPTTEGVVLAERFFSATHTPLFDATGRVAQILQHIVDVSELQVLQRERRAEVEPEALMNAIPTQVWTANPAGVLTYVNEQVTAYFGRGEREMLSRGWQEGIHPDDLTVVLPRWAHALATGDGYEVELRLRRADGAYRWHLARVLSMRDDSGMIWQWFGTNSDIDDRKRVADERVALIAALEHSNRELDSFAYVASHDLKAPLRGINNIAQWIEDDLGDRLTAESRAHLDMLRRRVVHMSSLIEGVLRYSRAGRRGEPIEEVAVELLVRGVVELLAPAAGVQVVIGDGMPTLSTSAIALQQVFLNLIGNAIKHAGREDARVDVRVLEDPERWVFSVSDNGPGIASQHQERVWALFQTLSTTDPDSTGIGLSIVRKTVAARQGSAWIESTPGEGATFLFTWPKREG
jgi:PAS domain S-box-containing protein